MYCDAQFNRIIQRVNKWKKLNEKTGKTFKDENSKNIYFSNKFNTLHISEESIRICRARGKNRKVNKKDKKDY